MYLLDTMKNRSRSLVQNSPFLRLQLNQPQRSPKAYFLPPLKYLGFVSNKDNVTDCFLNSSWYFRSPYFFFRALTRLRTARASGKNQPRPQGFSLFILSRSREFGNFKAKSWRDLRLSSVGGMPEIILGIMGLHEILVRDSGIKELYWGPSNFRFFEKV